MVINTLLCKMIKQETVQHRETHTEIMLYKENPWHLQPLGI